MEAETQEDEAAGARRLLLALGGADTNKLLVANAIAPPTFQFPSLSASIHNPQSSPLLDRIGANFGAELAPATFLVTCVRQARRGEARREVEVWVLLQLEMGVGGSILWQGGHPEGGKRTPHKWL